MSKSQRDCFFRLSEILYFGTMVAAVKESNQCECVMHHITKINITVSGVTGGGVVNRKHLQPLASSSKDVRTKSIRWTKDQLKKMDKLGHPGASCSSSSNGKWSGLVKKFRKSTENLYSQYSKIVAVVVAKSSGNKNKHV